jgi:hypothetical protein
MPRVQRGQALVLGLFVLFLGTISLFYLFSTGQVSADKQRLTNTADAAAYSAALWRARVLNYDAYSNRAMIANEVAIAQTLTLASELQFNKNLAACFAREEGDADTTCQSNLANIAQIIPYWVEIFEAVHYALEIGDQVMVRVMDAEITTRSAAVNRVLSNTQTLLHASANFVLLDNIVDDVVEANDANFRSTVLPDEFDSFTRRYTGNDRNRIANIVKRQLDPYSQQRRWNLELGICVTGLAFGYGYHKRGATVLSNNLDRWEAMDNLSEWRYSLGKGLRCRRREEPMSWADRNAEGTTNSPRPTNTRDNPDAFDLSRDNDTQYTVDSYTGIQPFRDLNYSNLRSDDPNVRNPRSNVAVVVTMGGENLRTANTLNVGTGRLRMTENLERNRLTAVGAAEVHFHRPTPRSDGMFELPSLFNPYWQARLVEPSEIQRAAARAL